MRITIEQHETTTFLMLEGRVAGPWAEELRRVWAEKASQLSSGKLSIDIRNLIYADAEGTQVLRDIYSQSHAELLASTPWTQHLARQIAGQKENQF